MWKLAGRIESVYKVLMEVNANTVLVTGGAGYIGSHTVLAMREAGFNVVVVDNLSTGYREAVPDDVPLVVCDVSDDAAVVDVLQRYDVCAVIHFAGSIIVPDSVSNPLKYYQNNTSASRDIIEICVNNNVRSFIFSSTASVYGMAVENPVSEDAETVPINPYGHSKLMTERILEDTAAAHDFRYVALRYFNVAGADVKGRIGQLSPNATHLIKVASQVATGQREFIEIFGDDYETPDGTCIRDYIHVMDLADAHVETLRYLLNSGSSQIFNCGYGHGYSVFDVLNAVERVTGSPLTQKIGPRRAGDPMKSIANTDKIRKYVDWKPQYDDLDLIVRTSIDWEQKLAKRSEPT